MLVHSTALIPKGTYSEPSMGGHSRGTWIQFVQNDLSTAFQTVEYGRRERPPSGLPHLSFSEALVFVCQIDVISQSG